MSKAKWWFKVCGYSYNSYWVIRNKKQPNITFQSVDYYKRKSSARKAAQNMAKHLRISIEEKA